jgi:uncharacterized membrane protein YeaQ/YmgE (transglycosylase-associated protein family)
VQGNVGKDASVTAKDVAAQWRSHDGTTRLSQGELMLLSILSAIIVGLIVGALGRLIIPNTKGISLIATALLGIAGAVVGSLIYGFFGGTDTPGIDWIRLVVQVIAAAIFVAIFVAVTRGRSGSKA